MVAPGRLARTTSLHWSWPCASSVQGIKMASRKVTRMDLAEAVYQTVGLNRAEFSGGWLAWILRGHRRDLKLNVVGGFRLGGRDVADGLEQAPIVVPIDPFEGGELD